MKKLKNKLPNGVRMISNRHLLKSFPSIKN